ncbi:MAG: hypothetical protein ONB44_08625 [candidate division KSB1 bacterium]|nr:hypothetical protein [candidate division KSB1 bacterium]MDZ7302194.1 hypothetical protein [candidate division KSB1 bacterium]MDZ7311303.1 hypothetical protein [candidate division KSB1 bacterium]
MMKSNRILPMMLMLGLPASMAAAQMPSELTPADCRSIFSRANSSEAIRTLESGVQWTEAWEHGAWGSPEEFLGYIFLNSLQHEGRTIGVLVGMTNTGVITEVRLKGLDGVEEEFLAQFRGKTVQDNFDLARTPEDLLFLPAKIKAMQGNFALSESIARGVKEIAMAAIKVVK